MVLRKPFSKVVRALNPNSCSARDVSRERRGWPSGLRGIEDELARETRESRDQLDQVAMVISMPAPRLTGSAPS